MPDNVTIGSGATVPVDVPTATDLIGGAHYQRVKLTHGVDGSAVDASATDPLPITGAATISGTVPVSVAAAAQVDGHSANIGALADASSASTLTGLLKNIKAALAGTLTVGGTVTTTPPSNASTNMAQIAGTTTDTNSGNKSAGTQRVVLATDQPALSTPMPVSLASVPSHAVTNAGTFAVQPSIPTAATATLASVAGSASSVTLIALNASRMGFVIVNDSGAILYVKFGSAASSTSYTYQLAPSATLDSVGLPFVYTGIITGIWASATGNARTTELSA